MIFFFLELDYSFDHILNKEIHGTKNIKIISFVFCCLRQQNLIDLLLETQIHSQKIHVYT